MDFVAIDVETANEDLASICQIGLASFQAGALIETWTSLVNPKDYFSPINISIHGIDSARVSASPTWEEIYPHVSSRLHGTIAVCHTPFDCLALAKACQNSDLAECACIWLDSARVVRRTWPQFAKSGYGLSNVAKFLKIQYQAHDALEDARCAGLMLLQAMTETGLSLDQWIVRVTQPIGAAPGVYAITRDGHEGGELSGSVIVFTGSLSLPRHTAADMASALGCRVDAGVTKHTTILVVGDQDIRHLAGHQKSHKHEKAETLIAKGQPIRILSETDFLRLVSHSAE
jgi:DNA polymerase III subunit epsilon